MIPWLSSNACVSNFCQVAGQLPEYFIDSLDEDTIVIGNLPEGGTIFAAWLISYNQKFSADGDRRLMLWVGGTYQNEIVYDAGTAKSPVGWMIIDFPNAS